MKEQSQKIFIETSLKTVYKKRIKKNSKQE